VCVCTGPAFFVNAIQLKFLLHFAGHQIYTPPKHEPSFVPDEKPVVQSSDARIMELEIDLGEVQVLY
jgi:hypothetical protein